MHFAFALGASQEGPEEQPPTLACGSSVEALAQTGERACSNPVPSPRGISRSGELRRQLDSEQPRPCWKQGSQLLRGIVREAHNLSRVIYLGLLYYLSASGTGTSAFLDTYCTAFRDLIVAQLSTGRAFALREA